MESLGPRHTAEDEARGLLTLGKQSTSRLDPVPTIGRTASALPAYLALAGRTDWANPTIGTSR